ncbi:uncharacterized protein APUU_31499A [Aspergillus puulaauensis]|uniref:Uncharacterized protein n=1 Tax=Aspergillus puulaauensis TaxID=1220207 RepID=A0A7R8AKW0_9EURO|nr:uncharacterized protein APUU_31499A [Aspergillus puulaauensis]BCS23274.1 hypothetical protein APUU_31499A [Aspergillus puulaauensis]
MEAENNSAPTRQTQNNPTAMQSMSGDAHIKGKHEPAQPMRILGPKHCNCEKGEDDDQDQSSAMGMIYDSNPAMAACAVCSRPLTLSPGTSSHSPSRGRTPQRSPSSPERFAQRSPFQANSPGSLIFERNVQEDILLPQSSSIPSHIRTENHIPPVLEASSEAITDNKLDPDSVEIVTQNIYLPTANSVPAEQSLRSPSPDPTATDTGDTEELQSTRHSLDANDIRRLSFISFADVVNAESAETGECPPGSDSFQRGAGSPNPSATVFPNMSPSPLYSPVSSHGFGTSPPTSISASFKGLELSPNRVAQDTESPHLAIQRPLSPSFSGDLNIETMSQALRRSGSGDLGAFLTSGNDG